MVEFAIPIRCDCTVLLFVQLAIPNSIGDNASAEFLDNGDGASKSGAHEYLGDGPQGILKALGGTSRGVVEGDGKLVVGVHFHLGTVSRWPSTGSKRTYVVRHLAHQLGSDFVKHVLKIDGALSGLQIFDAVLQDVGEGNVGENTEVGRVEKAQASLSLSLPHLSIGVDDAAACSSVSPYPGN